PVSTSTPEHALRAALAGQATLTTAPGCQTWVMVPEPAPGSFRDPDTGEPGLRLQLRDAHGAPLRSEPRHSASLAWWDHLPPGVGWGETGRIVLLTPVPGGHSGPPVIGAAGGGRLSISG